MTTPLPADVYRIPNNTTKYNALNAMQYPYLYGPISSIPPMGDLIDRELNNLQDYALSYPISGKAEINIDPQELYPGQTIVRTNNGIGKAVETSVKITPDAPATPAQFYVGDTDLSLGSNHFVELGVCGPESEDGCAGEKRMVYLRNIPTGEIPLFGNVSFESVLGCTGGFTAGRGTIPGMLEDISELAPSNFVSNVYGKGNFGGNKCRRLKLPVGAHIYDSSMKCKLDYNEINQQNTLQGRLQMTHKQVENNCPAGENPQLSKTWWFEEQCTPSFETAVRVDDIDADFSNGETNLIPVAEPQFYQDSVQPIPSIGTTESFEIAPAKHTHVSKKKVTKKSCGCTSTWLYVLVGVLFILTIIGLLYTSIK